MKQPPTVMWGEFLDHLRDKHHVQCREWLVVDDWKMLHLQAPNQKWVAVRRSGDVIGVSLRRHVCRKLGIQCSDMAPNFTDPKFPWN